MRHIDRKMIAGVYGKWIPHPAAEAEQKAERACSGSRYIQNASAFNRIGLSEI